MQNEFPSHNPTPRRPAAFARVFSIFALLMAFGFGSARAERLPDAAQAATHLGQEVEFADVIKAISRSRTKNGCYFSFGAPFPKQLLSVCAG